MTILLFTVGAVIAVVLLVLLALSIVAPPVRIWPTPGDGSWQGYVFWPLFRSLNLLCFAVAAAGPWGYLGLPTWMRALAFIAMCGAIAAFAYSFRVLGRDNSYCAADGLVTHGIYRWSRNPQNALLVVVYGALALAADSGSAYLLCGAMMAVYTLMVLAEEPWLEAAYGDAYRHYCRRVPRFFNWHRSAVAVRAWLRDRRQSRIRTLAI